MIANDHDDPVAAKKALRADAKAARANAFARHGRAASEAVAAKGIAFADAKPDAIVSGFSAIGDEIDPAPLMAKLADQGHRLCLPAMQGKGLPLLFRRWSPGDATAETVWGIREPLPSAPEAHPDVILVALLAFDARGYRLGYGGGFFDRTLAKARAGRSVTAIGLAYDEQEIAAVPHAAYDERLDWVLTPARVIRCL